MEGPKVTVRNGVGVVPSKYELTLEQKKNLKEWIESDEFNEEFKNGMEACRKTSEVINSLQKKTL